VTEFKGTEFKGGVLPILQLGQFSFLLVLVVRNQCSFS
jgi:hypothetical protein